MFEIILSQDYEDIFFFREFEVNGISANSPERYTPDRNSRSLSRRSGRSGSPGRKPASILYSTDNGKVVISSPNLNKGRNKEDSPLS